MLKYHFHIVPLCALLLTISVSTLSCTRANHDDSARIVLEVPPLAPSPSNAGKVSSLTYTVEPRNLSEINCLYLVVAADEPSLSGLKCGTVNADNSLNEIFTGGKIFGGARLSTTEAAKLEVFVTSGAGRHFYLLGSKRSRDDGCISVGERLNFPSSTSTSINSNLYVLGHSARYDLPGGSTVPIEMPVSLDTSNWIKECRGKSEDTTATSPTAMASNIWLQKASSPGGNTVAPGTCVPFKFELRNPLSRPSSLTSNLTIKMEMDSTGSNNDDFDSVDTYATYSDCVAGTSGGDFSLTQPSIHALRWIKMPPDNLEGRISIIMLPSILSLIPSHFSQTVNAKSAINLESSTQKIFEIDGPRLIAAGDHCYPYAVTVRDLDGLSYSGETFRFSNYAYAYQVYSDSSCTSEITAGTATAPGTIYVKFLKTQGAGRQQIVVLPTATTGSSPKLQYTEVFTLGIGTTPATLGIIGPSAIRVGQCERLFATVQNSLGATLPNSGGTRSITISASTSVIYSGSSCTSPQSSHVLSFSDGDTMKEFYVKSTATDLTIYATATGLTSGTKAVVFQPF